VSRPGPNHADRYLGRTTLEQRNLLLAAAVLIGLYYLGAAALGIYPAPALAVGLCLPPLLALVAWRLPRASPREKRRSYLALTCGFSGLTLGAASLAAGTACVGFQVIWALPLIYLVLVPYALEPLLAGTAVSVVGGLSLMIHDGHPASHVAQWGAIAMGAAAFAAHRLGLNRRERLAFLEQERRQEARVASSEDRYRLLADHTQDVIWTLDLATQRFTYVSPSVLRQRGYTVEEAMAQRLDQALTPESLARVGEVLAGIGTPAEEDPHFGVYDQPCRDGSVKHVEITATLVRDAAGGPMAVTGASRDVTPRVAAERALRRSEERFRALIEKASDMILVFDPKMRIRFVSPSAADTLGWSADEVVGRSLWDLQVVHPEDVAAVAAATSALVRGDHATMRIRARHRHKDGSWRLLEGLGRNLLEDPAVQGVVVNARDVTEQERLEEHLRQAQKLESIGRLAGGAAHDFNNLLTVMLSCTHALQADAAAGRPLDEEALVELSGAGDRARELTRQLLTFARRQPFEPVPLDLNEVIRTSERLLQRVIPEDVAVEIELGPDLWPIHGDAGQLEQVVLNLALNARDAMPGGGTLLIRTRRGSQDAARGRGEPGQPSGDWVWLELRDTGAGMSREMLGHLFEPFFTTKPKGLGTGLGLATAYGIVKQHGGHIQVESEPGRGTTFQIGLPRWTGAAGRAPTPQATAALPGGDEPLLVVDDDALMRSATARLLRSAGYRVRTAGSGAEALELVAGPEGLPSLVVTDVVMRAMGGRAVAQALRERAPDLPVLYVSGYASGALGDEELSRPRTAFLAKPFTPDEILSEVRGLLDRRERS
jgi:two-component system, cell cycle sensor histidine kinase and response regulator CckA